MSHSKKDEELEDFRTFIDLNIMLQKEVEKQNPSREQLKKILESMLDLIKG